MFISINYILYGSRQLKGIGMMFNLDDKLSDIKINFDVTFVLNNIVSLIEEWYTENEVRSYKRQIRILHENEYIYNTKIKELEIERDIVKKELTNIKQGAYDVREKLCVDISEVLYKSRHHSRLEDKVRELEKDNKSKDVEISKLQNELRDTQDMIVTLEHDMKATANILESSKDISSSNSDEHIQDDFLKISDNNKGIITNPQCYDVNDSGNNQLLNADIDKIDENKESYTLLDFESDLILLQIFSYLNTTEVLNAAQSNRFIFKRVDTLFGIDSKLALEEWSIKSSKSVVEIANDNVKNSTIPSSVTKGLTASSIVSSALEAFGAGILPGIGTSSSTHANSSTSTTSNPNSLGLLTQEMAEMLSKKLTAIELKAIIAISERLKKKCAEVDQLTVEKEDISARLHSAEEVRDFLVDKLKNAELALKASMHEVASLKKQASADNEVISFLDLKEQALNTENSILVKKCERLQASYDLLSQSNNQNEQSLIQQMDQYKTKYEDLEISYKAEKKVLVKEVKSLRNQLETISVERNMYKQQIASLKQTLSIPSIPDTIQSKSNINRNYK